MRVADRARRMRCCRGRWRGCSGSRWRGWRWSAALRCGRRRSAHSVALLAFGADSLVEMLSATVVLLQFFPRFPLKKDLCGQGCGGAVVCAGRGGGVHRVAGRARPMETSRVGIGVTALALVVMPVLAWMKRRQARRMNNRALAADATQSATCAYLAAVTLAGLAIYAVWQIRWVDTVAALVAVPLLIVEGRRAWRGEGCGCG